MATLPPRAAVAVMAAADTGGARRMRGTGLPSDHVYDPGHWKSHTGNRKP